MVSVVECSRLGGLLAKLRWLAVALAVACAPLPALAAEHEPHPLTVLLDDNYPPYIFRDEHGNLRGILPDSWAAWSRRTGIPVRLEAGDWGEVLRRFNAGEGDVVDTIFRTETREKIYDFSQPYATIEVPIWFSSDLSGITDVSTLRGFTIGVKDGDACIDFLSDRQIDSFHRYDSYEAMVDAAGRGDVRVFCLDRPPGTYFLVKKGLASGFKTSPPLYSGRFHRAVRKGNGELLEQVEAGFANLGESERRAIEERWLGRPQNGLESAEFQRSLGLSLLAGLALASVLLAWVWTLRRQVNSKTGQLRGALGRLELSESRFRTIFENINDAILIHDVATGAIVMANCRATEMYGWTVDELLASKVGDLSLGIPPYSQVEAREWIDRSAEGPQVFEWRAKRKDGSLFWAEVGLRRALFDEGTERLLVVVRDISDRKESAVKLERMVTALTRSNADLERFAFAASHDLREPLITVVRYSQLIQRRYSERLDADASEFMDFIVRGAKQMLQLVAGLLAFSRIGGEGGEFADVDCHRALSGALENLAAAIQESEAEITAGPMPVLKGDELHLVQLLQNLIGNGIKYRKPESRPEISIAAKPVEHGWEFTVTDNGIGIEPDYRDQIFVIFKRLHTKQAIPGEGIGLALCQRIVERHGGRIWVDSAGPDGGSVFHFTILTGDAA